MLDRSPTNYTEFTPEMAIPFLRRVRRLVGASRPGTASVSRRRTVPMLESMEPRTLLSGTVAAANTNYVGVAFEPYVKQWNSTKNAKGQYTTPFWNSYVNGNASVMNQLSLIAKNFSSVATYSSGWFSAGRNLPLNEYNSNILIPGDAAQYNKQQGALKLTVSQGIFQQDSPAAWKSEIETAIKITKSANQTYPGTVNRLIFSNEYVRTPAEINQVNHYISQYKSQVPGIQVGVRLENLGAMQNGSADVKAALKKLVQNVNFLMVNIYPSIQVVPEGPVAGAQYVATTYNNLKALAKSVNPNVQVIIGETGWPSQGPSFNDLKGKMSSVANEQAYYKAFSQWAKTNAVTSYFFEAIDEPWKSNKNVSPDSPAGRAKPWTSSIGGEGHFGLYTYTTNNDSGQFVAKFPLS